MRESWEMVTASLMQSTVQVRKKKHISRPTHFKKKLKKFFGALGVGLDRSLFLSGMEYLRYQNNVSKGRSR